MTDKTLDDRIDDALARLNAREDPPPPPELPKFTTETVFDIRMVVNQHFDERHAPKGMTLDLIDANGNKLHTQQGFATLMRWVAGLTADQEWIDKRLRLYGRRTVERIDELKKLAQPAGLQQRVPA